jgi:hypothetical protein
MIMALPPGCTVRSALCKSRLPLTGIADADVQECLYGMTFRGGCVTANTTNSGNARDLAKVVAACEPGDVNVRRVEIGDA